MKVDFSLATFNENLLVEIKVLLPCLVSIVTYYWKDRKVN